METPGTETVVVLFQNCQDHSWNQKQYYEVVGRQAGNYLRAGISIFENASAVVCEMRGVCRSIMLYYVVRSTEKLCAIKPGISTNVLSASFTNDDPPT